MFKFNKPNHKDIGKVFEQRACQYLEQHGLKPICKNFSTKLGEIDLIMQDNDTLVFVEVKYRANTDFGEPSEMVTASKQRKLTKTAQIYLQRQGLNAFNTLCRFDVISIKGLASNIEFSWLKNAFNGV